MDQFARNRKNGLTPSTGSAKHQLKGKLSPFWNLVELVLRGDLEDGEVREMIEREAKNCQSKKGSIVKLINQI